MAKIHEIFKLYATTIFCLLKEIFKKKFYQTFQITRHAIIWLLHFPSFVQTNNNNCLYAAKGLRRERSKGFEERLSPNTVLKDLCLK